MSLVEIYLHGFNPSIKHSFHSHKINASGETNSSIILNDHRLKPLLAGFPVKRRYFLVLNSRGWSKIFSGFLETNEETFGHIAVKDSRKRNSSDAGDLIYLPVRLLINTMAGHLSPKKKEYEEVFF